VQDVCYAFAPLHNLELPRGRNVVTIGDFRIVRVRPLMCREREIPKAVLEEMRRSRVLQRWASELREGYFSSRESTPKYVLYFFPPAQVQSSWMVDAKRDIEQASRSFDAFLAALRLHKREYVSTSGSLGVTRPVRTPEVASILQGSQEPVNTPGIPMLANPRYMRPGEAVYTLPAADTGVLEQLVAKTTLAFETRLAMALRRFVGSRDKEDDDRFVDLLVTLETLYGDSDRTAVGHKIAFRAATICGRSGADRGRVFKLLKKAYGDRSTILHGRGGGGSPANLDTVDDLTRRSLVWFVNGTAASGRPPEGLDVDKLCFEDTSLQ
jgi:hypothetical protein